MKNILNKAFLILYVLYFTSVSANDRRELIEDWNLVGTAELSILWFDVYEAQLKTANGAFDKFTTPMQLILNYQRDIAAQKLLEETDKQLASRVPEDTRRIWIEQLQAIWPDVKKGDQLIIQTELSGRGDFFFNGEWVGAVEETNFSQNFVQIWLGYQSAYPKLAEKLRGESF